MIRGGGQRAARKRRKAVRVMKVVEFFNHMNISSNAIIYGINVNEMKDNKKRIFYTDITNHKNSLEWAKKAKLNSFTVRDNEIHIFYEL